MDYGNMMQRVQNLEAVLNEGLRIALLEKTPAGISLSRIWSISGKESS